MRREIDRRTFIRTGALGGGGLVLGLLTVACDAPEDSATTTVTTTPATTETISTEAPAGAVFDPHVLLRIDSNGLVTITVPKSEMGQGVRTALAMIVAEELDADWERVRVETAAGDGRFGDQVTGGSLSISTRYDMLRTVGATARTMLVTAAANGWGVAPDSCTTNSGVVEEIDGDRTASYGELVESAAGLDPPASAEIVLKEPTDFRIIGTDRSLVDAPDIVRGAALYGSDVRLPDMVFGVVARPPVFGDGVDSFDATEALAVPGVIDVIQLSYGVAVVGENTWAALQGRSRLSISWDGRGDRTVDDASVLVELRDRLEPTNPASGESTAEYTHPYFSHLAMETPTCTAHVTDQGCEVWAATQDPQLAKAIAAGVTGLSQSRVTVHVPLIGGAFGRRLDQDFVEQAVELAAVVRRPVQLFWDRTDDIRNDRYHPAGVVKAVGLPSDPTSIQLQTALAGSRPVPIGDWRSVTNAPTAFARESFIDEMAIAAGEDPYEYRRGLLGGRALATLDLAATQAGWGRPLPPGSGRGIAHHATWEVSPTTMVVEVVVAGDQIQVTRVICAIDCGILIHPGGVVAQIEGAVAFGLSACLLGGVTVTGGGVAETNFGDRPILAFDGMPEVEVHLVASGEPPTGVGEAGVPPLAPAVANAVFAVTGRRLRDLPLRLA